MLSSFISRIQSESESWLLSGSLIAEIEVRSIAVTSKGTAQEFTMIEIMSFNFV